MFSVLRASRLFVRRPLYICCIRLQSKKPNHLSQFNDAKLREIIEGTNFGTESAKQEKLEEERKILEKERQVERQREKRGDREAKIADANEENRANFSSTESGKLKGKDTLRDTTKDGLCVENKIIATTEGAVDDSDIPNLAKEINDSIQKEISGLPSQKQQNQSAMTKKITKYLDSAHDTILTVTRALNDVTGYSAIEKLKISIQEQEADLKEAKKYVKECKVKYGEAIQKRSHSQREVNELLTRKHNWSPQDLERFTELYRNDHENEHWVQNCEKQLEEAESKVDGIQLKLTQSILTRYHEEQIWSDKIRRSSTWGTWVLMGLNVLLFVVATFLVEPWKRKKLVLGFEDKVKSVLVGISKEDEAILNPILDKMEQENVNAEQAEQKQEQEIPLLGDFKDEKHQLSPSVITAHGVYENAKQKSIQGWQKLKQLCITNYVALTSPEIHYLKLDKLEFGIFTLIISILSCSLGSILTLIYK
ncbi:SHE9 [Candida oxycetoniae]|uniref:Sensitive to high expression protein 9, mitochondrial n=1 Tax=Candida oxycetoniae TaxID=497107 RepID=A0AAI9WXV9_9ASCO|nr:SHE9 [Candida oxycetoniae]KAI3404727.2 SHE9 [Candida oxycetoniae]